MIETALQKSFLRQTVFFLSDAGLLLHSSLLQKIQGWASIERAFHWSCYLKFITCQLDHTNSNTPGSPFGTPNAVAAALLILKSNPSLSLPGGTAPKTLA